ncbi:MAG: chemotaxis protein CheW [Betaproteobacteria bacterium]|nr:chemotaxis protein CheW [Betaproteobacteria bacterium]
MGMMEIIDNGKSGNVQEFLSFQLGDEEYGIDILAVREIRAYEKPTRIANAPEFIRGVINLRGVIVPIVDLRIQFGNPQPRYDALSVVIILHVDGRPIGVVVDGVSDVVPLTAAEIRPAPEFHSASATRFISGLATVQGRMLIMMDIEKLLAKEAIRALEGYAQAA